MGQHHGFRAALDRTSKNVSRHSQADLIELQSTKWLRRLFAFVLLSLFDPGTVLSTPVTSPARQLPGGQSYQQELDRMIEAIRRDLQTIEGIDGGLHPTVERAMRAVARQRFVPQELREYAFENRPLPIGREQTISQPTIVALMTQLLGVGAGDRVLEIGTGSGYQAAVLAEIGCEVISLEIIPELSERAAALLSALGYEQVRTIVADGYRGWPDEAPYDAIIVTAAAPQVPEALLEQLRPGAPLVIPVGRQSAPQELQVITVDDSGRRQTRSIIPVLFVPMVPDE